MAKKPTKPENDSASVEDIAALVQDSEMSPADVYHNSYLSRGTINRLLRGQTRYPQHMTLRGVAAAAGYEYVLRKVQLPRRKPKR